MIEMCSLMFDQSFKSKNVFCFCFLSMQFTTFRSVITQKLFHLSEHTTFPHAFYDSSNWTYKCKYSLM